ncbi:hypothetical protein J7K60_06065 [Candidatus Bipolaricaulota bacterium]|nr:hypothetical protein [Candidatus Bipolaricaulota bacterium]
MSRSIDTVVDDFVSLHCSPTADERNLVKDEYASLCGMSLGGTFQTGSYARFTVITPLNDLDVIWVIPTGIRRKLEEKSLTMDVALSDVTERLRDEYHKAGRSVKITPQSHSIMIEFLDLAGDFSIDIVPAYELTETNEFGDPLYRISEVGLMSRRQRGAFYETHDASIPVDWIKTDPRGYIEQARRTNKLSGSFRRATKLLKKWKVAWRGKTNFKSTEFKLKSFHIEIAIQHLIHDNSKLSTLDATERFMADIDAYLAKPQFKDRAQTAGKPTRYIDQYVSDLDYDQKRVIRIAARSGVILIQQLRKADNEQDIEWWLNRFLSGEEFIQAYGHRLDSSAIHDDACFAIDGNVRNKPGFPFGWLTKSIPLRKGLTRGSSSRKIDFKVTKRPEGNYVTYWKVRNSGVQALKDDALRGEICKHSTLNTPETTRYKGDHYVSCYLVDESENRVVAYNSVTVKII